MQKQILHESAIQKVSTSTLDPTGFVFTYNQNIYRAVKNDRSDDVLIMIRQPWVSHLIDIGFLVDTSESPISIKDNNLVLSHETINYRIQPSCMTLGFIRDAALRLIYINKLSLKNGYQLIDSHLWNFMADQKAKPKWVDFGSFIPFRECDFNRTEFLTNYLFPLLIAKRYPKLRRLLRLSLNSNGINADEFRALIPESEDILSRLEIPNKALEDRLRFWDACQSIIESLDSFVVNTTWQGYYKKNVKLNSYSERSFEQPPEDRLGLIKYIIDRLDFNTAADIGANSGVYTALLDKPGRHIAALDFDEGAIEELYNNISNSDLQASYAVGKFDVVNNAFSNLIGLIRKPDLVLALAITHHLILAQGLSFEQVASIFADITTSFLLIEFMPLGLTSDHSKAQANLPAYYNEQGFISALKTKFKTVNRYEPTTESRILFLCTNEDLPTSLC